MTVLLAENVDTLTESNIYYIQVTLRYYIDSHSTMAATCLLTPWAMVLNF